MTTADPIDALKARVASLDPARRETLRRQLEARGIAWDRVAPPEAVALAVATEAGRLPLSPAQRHFRMQQQLDPASPAFHIGFAWRFRGPLDADSLEATFRYVIARHEPLRTGFPVEDGEACQCVEPAVRFDLGRTDLSADPDRLTDAMQVVVDRPFDLESPPLLRAVLFRLGDEDHALAIAIHHIVADGWSRGLLMRELAAGYRAILAGRDPALAPLASSWSAQVHAEAARLGGPDAARQKAWWERRLADLEPQELPADRPRAGLASNEAGTLLRPLPEPLAAAVRDLAPRLGTTTFTLLLATFQLLVHRYCGQRDLSVCVPTAGRRDPHAAGLVGLFVNTLVLRTQLAPGLSFRGWLDRVRETVADAFEHQEHPFAQVVEALGIHRDAGQSPLLQLVFQVQTEGYRAQNAETLDFGVAGLAVTQELLPPSAAKADLSWYVMERGEGMAIAAEYRRGLFDAARIARMADHFERLLAAVVAAPDAPLPALDPLLPEERAELIARGRIETRPLPHAGVHDAIAAVAARDPVAPALVCGGRTWRYGELEAAADRLARHLLARPELGRPGARVAVCLPRSAMTVIAFLAVLKAGAVYVPLDPKHPAERIGYVLEDADAALLLHDGSLPLAGPVMIDPAAFKDEPPPVALPPTDPRGAAYLLYTSGSTGRPKGAVIEHAGLMNQMVAFARQPGIGPGDRMLAVTTVAFDISILEMLLPLASGATVVLVDQDLLLSPADLAETLRAERITHMQATPASWRMLLDSGWPGDRDLTAMIGGEALDGPLARRLLERTGSLWNLYGPTETTIWASALKIEPRHARAGKAPIGDPIDNMRFHLLDAYLEPVPDGVPGELFIGGIGVGPGYWRRPELTSEKFVPDPYALGEPGARLYRTGDVVVRRVAGELEFVGRTDFQIKLRGYRIEVGEIESLLQDDPAVVQALVILDGAQERLVAYCRTGIALSAAETGDLERALRRRLAERLPRYMVPSAFVVMTEFPLNTNGKVDRKRLPEPVVPEAAAQGTAPRTAREAALLAIWRDVLGRGDIGVDDNFFDLGGDSVAGMRIVARARARGLMLDPAELFEHQTVAAQAEAAREVPEAEMPAGGAVAKVASSPNAGLDQLVSRLSVRQGDA
ncbi:non-ribosomal peptide synthetase [Methylobrevis pamukkalensis]|uniref:Linear gramicidin synthase subunit D n=1 Tax=Methylobrevis pamukkalensis TaxID=1439726 RepID=A0A1E3H786_9HYPH|nr:non-ribosomal peptide synthetase [Methylobrevis pamukkalensis]ODN72182.1 Linear gramicidin synthase subunit D [Methylobrevis pamukkalensis]